MKEQKFKYHWTKNPQTFICEQDLRHAICNSDLMPEHIITSQNKIFNETIDAVIEAVKATPKYASKKRQMIDYDKAIEMLNRVYKGEMNELCITPLGVENMLKDLARNVSILEIQ